MDDTIPAKGYENLTAFRLNLLRNGPPRKPCDGYFGPHHTKLPFPRCAAGILARSLVYWWALYGLETQTGPEKSGLAQNGGSTMIVTISTWTHGEILSDCNRTLEAAVFSDCQKRVAGMSFMHELGHTLGLGHGGGDTEGFKPNYLSVMNYGFEFENNVKDRPLDFSRVQLPDLFEKKLDETLGLRKTAGESWPPPGLDGRRARRYGIGP